MEKKKILFKISYLGIGGIERLAIDILNNLKFEDKEFVLMLENEENNIMQDQLDDNIEIVYLKPRWFNSLAEKIRSKKKNILYKILYNLIMPLDKILLANGVNNYIKNNKNIDMFVDYNGEAGKYIHKIKAKKKIMWNHLSISNKSKEKIKRFGERLKNYDMIVTICDEMKEELEKEYPFLKEKIKRIYNFIDIEKINEKLLEEISEQDKKLMEESYCVSVGRLAEPKDYETTIKAFELLRKKGIKEKLYIIGEGVKKEELKKLIKEKNLEQQILLLGQKNNPYIWMKNADIFVHSSKLEGFAMVLLEAMTTKLPIVTSICKTGVKEILEFKIGEGYSIGDYKTLAIKIENLLNDESKRKEYIKNSKKVITEFSKTKILEEYRKVFL